MAIKRIKLSKTVQSNKSITERVPTDFQKLVKPTKNINEERLKEIYDDIFYDIPKEGKDSHKNIVEQTYEHLYQTYNRNLESRNRELVEKVAIKNSELDGFDGLTTLEHDFYENGSLIMAGANGTPFQDSNNIWIMQEGRKRKFESDSSHVFIQTKKALGLPLDGFDGRYFISISELNSIPNGTDIIDTTNLNETGNQIIPEEDMEDFTLRHAYKTIEIACMGLEVADVLQYQLYTTDSAVDYSQAQYILSEEGCVVKYLVDDFHNDDVPLEVKTITMAKDEVVTIQVLRDGIGIEDQGIPNNINDYYESEGAYDIADVTYNGDTVPGYIKLWGPYGSEFRSIVYCSGRVMYREVGDTYIQNTLMVSQDTTSQYVLNGVPTTLFTDTGTTAEVEFVDAGGESAYGTKLIYKGDGENLWGNLNQSSVLQSLCFNNPECHYYRTSKTCSDHNNSVTGKVYGQPIVAYNSKWNVLLGIYRKNYWGVPTRRIFLYDIKRDKCTGYKYFDIDADKTDYPIEFSWNPKIIKWHKDPLKSRVLHQTDDPKRGYVGLAGYQTNNYEGEGNPFMDGLGFGNYFYPDY
tara:strand:+ start:887 stop:2620 length:1734 start_codon:yes stop_codon:yes gene_type:complete